MRKTPFSIVLPLAIASLFIIVVNSCKKTNQDSCWECMGKSKSVCQDDGKCAWEPKITIDQTWSNNNTVAYQVNDNGRCMCSQDNVTRPEKNAVNLSSLPFYTFNNVTSIGADRNNNIWVSHDNVTEYYNGTVWTTNSITPYDNTSHTSVNTPSVDYAVSSGNYVFAATSLYGLATLNANPESNSWTYYQMTNSTIPTNQLNDVYAESDNRVWLATKNYGIVKFDLPGTFTSYSNSNTTLHSANINCITADHSGNIWFGTDNGFGELVNGTVKEYFVGTVHDVAVDASGSIWAATDDGCKRLNTSSNTMEYYGTETSGLNTSSVTCFTVDKTNKLWIGTNAGLYGWDGTKISKYTPANEYQIGTFIKNMSTDQLNRVWIATDKGVSMMAQ